MSPLFPTLALLASPKNLSEYLAAHPWNAAQDGPLLVLEPERARAKGPVAGFASFGRKKATVGGISALVSPTRIDIDDSLSAPPNLYEGLPAEAKVLYLLRSLNPEQWRTATTRGIGLGDLQGEQRPVYESLLPKRFGWTSNRLDEVGFWGENVGKGTLNDQERARVRMKVERTVEMQVYFQEKNAISNWGTNRYHGAPKTVTYQRDKDDDFVQKGAFGLEVRKVVPNLPKPSELDTKSARFDASIPVGPKATVGEVLRTVGRTVGAEIVPDFRVADRAVVLYGKASARDLLGALALSVEGTYRRVGTAYVLTSDLAGMGARKLKVAQWENRLRRDTERRMDAWRQEIGEGYGRIPFGADGPEVGAAAKEAIQAGDQRSGPDKEIDPSSLGPELRRFLDQWDKEYTTQPIRKDKVVVSSALAYRFVLPDGHPLDVERTLGFPFQFRKPGERSRPTYVNEGKQPPFEVSEGVKPSFRIAAEEPAAAVAAVRAVGRYPGSTVWLNTHSKEALGAALEAAKPLNVSVGLALRPWRRASYDYDRNIAGDFGDRLKAKMPEPEPNDWRPMDLRPQIGMWMSPSDPNVAGAWSSYRDLAALPGLVGTMLLETQPFGYEPVREEWMSTSQPLDWATVGHGYTTVQRLAFLRQEGVDPIDIGDGGYWTTPDLRQTYFFDDGLRGMPSVYDGSDDTNPKTREVGKRWRAMLGKANQAAVERLAASLPGPVWIEQRLPNVNTLGEMSGFVAAWKPGMPLPVYERRGMAMPAADSLLPIRLGIAPGEADYERTKAILADYVFGNGPGRRGQLLLDLSDVPPAKIEATMRRWLKGP